MCKVDVETSSAISDEVQRNQCHSETYSLEKRNVHHF
jgi:hypothetical protein